MSQSNSSDLAQLQSQLTSITEMLSARRDRDEAQKQAFDKLYEELEQYKRDFVFQSEKPLLLDLLLYFDSLSWFQQSLLNQATSREVLAESFQYLIDEFLELLYRRDVLPHENSDAFDPKTQRAIQVIPTQDPSRDQSVQRIIKPGFSRAGRTLRPAQVAVHRYQAPASDAEPSAEEAG